MAKRIEKLEEQMYDLLKLVKGTKRTTFTLQMAKDPDVWWNVGNRHIPGGSDRTFEEAFL